MRLLGETISYAVWNKCIQIRLEPTATAGGGPVKIDCIAFTHNGLVRSNNEDCILCDGWMRNRTMADPVKFSSPSDSSEVRVFAVADGLGGHSSGEVASQFALSKLCSSVADLPAVSEKSLAKVLKDLHRSLFNISTADPEYRGMGATMAGLVADPAGAIHLFHVGDSRVYRREGRFLQLLTADDRFESSEYGETEPGIRPTSTLLQCLGGLIDFAEIAPHIARFEMSDAPEMFLICSDGLSDMISQDEMEEAMSESTEATVRALFERVKSTGAKDNISIMIVELFPQPRSDESPVIAPGGPGVPEGVS